MTSAAPEQLPPPGRPTWTGAITFGLVAVPVKLSLAVETHSGPVLHQVHRDDGARIRNRTFCETENREITRDEIASGAEIGGGTVILTEDDMAQLPVPSRRVIDVHAFVDEKVINPVGWDTPYYVTLGDKAPAKPYKLLARALHDSGQVAITKVTIRSRESLAILRERDGLLILQTVRWPDEIRGAEGIRRPDVDDEVRPQEIQMAQQLMDSMSEGYDLESERDGWVQALNDILRAKTTGGEGPHGMTPAAPAVPTVDLMEALQQSISASRAARGEPAAPAPAAGKTSTAKKTATKRTPRRAS